MIDDRRTAAAIALGEAYARHVLVLHEPAPTSTDVRTSARNLMVAKRAAVLAGVGRDDALPGEGGTNG